MKREKPVEKSAEDAAREAAERKAAVPEQSLEVCLSPYPQERRLALRLFFFFPPV